MDIVRYTDNDAVYKPETGNSPVYTVVENKCLTKEGLYKKLPKAFSDGVGLLEGQYHIKVDKTVDPVQHTPWRVLVALRTRLQVELDRMAEENIIAPVTTPTRWVSSLVVVPKPNGKLRICLDPKDLNIATQREHYPLPTIEDVVTRLQGAKVSTKLDVKNGFWHVELDEESSFLTTFNTLFQEISMDAHILRHPIGSRGRGRRLCCGGVWRHTGGSDP